MKGYSKIKKIVSGGQTGVDRAALDFALRCGIPCGGWCPKGRLAEDGTIDERYPLCETPTDVYAERTEWNVRDSSATLILAPGELEGGTKLTLDFALKYDKPSYVIDMNDEPNLANFADWIENTEVETLNIAGPRESLEPGRIYQRTASILSFLFKNVG